MIEKRISAPRAICQSKLPTPMPMVHNGGIKATAIAIPTSVLLIFLFALPYAPTRPDEMATTISKRLGFVRASISLVYSAIGTKNANMPDIKTARTEPFIIEPKDVLISCVSPQITPYFFFTNFFYIHRILSARN